jgi:hypothetical protein
MLSSLSHPHATNKKKSKKEKEKIIYVILTKSKGNQRHDVIEQ